MHWAKNGRYEGDHTPGGKPTGSGMGQPDPSPPLPASPPAAAPGPPAPPPRSALSLCWSSRPFPCTGRLAWTIPPWSLPGLSALARCPQKPSELVSPDIRLLPLSSRHPPPHESLHHAQRLAAPDPSEGTEAGKKKEPSPGNGPLCGGGLLPSAHPLGVGPGAGPTGFEPAISALTGRRVRPGYTTGPLLLRIYHVDE